MKTWINEAVDIPLVSSEELLPEKWLILDILVSDHRQGMVGEISAGDYFFPLLWRPRIKMHGRLRDHHGNSTIGTFTIKKLMSWKRCFAAIFSWSSVFWGSAVSEGNMKELVLRSVFDMLVRAKRAVNC